MRRITTKSRKGGSHPTRTRLIAAVTELMQDHIPEAITTDMVLAHSGISKGSLYHHFEDLADLIETVLIEQFSQMVDQNAIFLKEVVETATNVAEMLGKMRQLTQTLQGPDRRDARMNRARLIVFSHGNPRLSKKLADEQSRLTAAYVEAIRLGTARGLFKSDVDPFAAAVFIQSYTLGKLIDDIAHEHVPEEAWINLVMRVIENFSAQDA